MLDHFQKRATEKELTEYEDTQAQKQSELSFSLLPFSMIRKTIPMENALRFLNCPETTIKRCQYKYLDFSQYKNLK